MNKKVFLFIATTTALFVSPYIAAYELGTHARLTEKAYERSFLVKDTELLDRLGLRNETNPFGEVYYDISGTEVRERWQHGFESLFIASPEDKLTIKGWLLRGAIREDDAFGEDNPQDDTFNPELRRPLHHFFDPRYSRPLTVPGIGLLDSDIHSAPNWAVGSRDVFNQPNTPESNRRNHFSVFDAREALYRALTGRRGDDTPDPHATDTQGRHKYWATTFRALGDGAHLIQDMAQPQHTRNDPHAGKFPEFLTGHASVYEKYLEARATGARFFDIDGQTDVPVKPLGPALAAEYPVPRFTQYSDFWSTGPGPGSATGQGLADYSNRGFFSAGTNLGSNEYPLPANNPDAYTPESAEGLLPRRPRERIRFLRGNVPDPRIGPANIRLTTDSIFDLFLVNTPPTYSLNRYNYDDQAALLIPRAVAYSAGLIDYFFRGRLEVQDAGYTDQGMVLRVKNAIDPQQQDEWKAENLAVGGTLLATLQYKVPDASQPAGETVKFHTSDSVALDEEIKPGRASWDVFTFTGLPELPQNAKEVEYRLVYRGRLGNEEDAIAVGKFKPVSGFVVTPSYVPADGIAGGRLIYKTSGGWRLSKDTGLVAGNTDWKGWYRNGKPTKVLSWIGSQARYFPDDGFCQTYRPVFGFNRCQWISSSTLSPEIYENGARFARAPADVLAAAVVRDTQGEDWLVAVCKQGTADVIYRRPYKSSDSAALFNAVSAPEGWREIGRYNGKALDQPNVRLNHDADIPWFFNGSGTQAQTMRRWWDIADGDLHERLTRLMLTIDSDVMHAKVVDLDNLGGGSTSASCTSDYDANGVGNAQQTRQDNGEYVIAVDYKHENGTDREQLATVHWSVKLTTTSTVSAIKETDPITNVERIVAIDGTTTYDNTHGERMQWGAAGIVVLTQTEKKEVQWHNGKPQASYAQTKSSDFHELEIAYYLDLRHDVFSFYEWGWADSASFKKADGVLTNAEGAGSFHETQRIRFPVITNGELTPFKNSDSYTFQPNTQETYELHCVAADTQPPTPTYVYNFGWNWDHPVGGWAIDTQNNLVLSQQIYADGGYELIGPYNYLLGAELKVLIPSPAASEPVYFPVGLVR